MTRADEIRACYPEKKPVAFNYGETREKLISLAEELDYLIKEVSRMTRESLRREIQLAKLEAEATHALATLGGKPCTD